MAETLKELGDHLAASFPGDIEATQIAYGELVAEVKRASSRRNPSTPGSASTAMRQVNSP